MTMAQDPYFSVVIAVRNGEDHLDRCLRNIEAQTEPSRETLVIDGASTDGTVDIIRDHEKHLAHWVSEPDEGLYDAWNKALDHTRGQWIVFLGADDRFAHDHVLELAKPRLEAAADAGHRYAYGTLIFRRPDGTVQHLEGQPWHKYRDRLEQNMCMPHSGSFHHRDLFEEVGRFDASFRIQGDYEFLLRATRHREPCFLEDLVVVDFELGGFSTGQQHALAKLKELRRVRRKHDLPVWDADVLRSEVHNRAWEAFHDVLGHDRGQRMLRTMRKVLRRERPEDH